MRICRKSEECQRKEPCPHKGLHEYDFGCGHGCDYEFGVYGATCRHVDNKPINTEKNIGKDLKMPKGWRGRVIG